MAVFSSDQVNHVFVAVGNGSLVGTIPAVGDKNVQIGGAVKDADGNDKYVGGVTFDEVTAVNEQTLADIMVPAIDFGTAKAGQTIPTIAAGDEVEVTVRINGALCDDEGNEFVLVGVADSVVNAVKSIEEQTTGARAENSVAGQLVKVNGTTVELKPTTQDPTLGDLRVLPRLTGFIKVTKADANGNITPLSKVEGCEVAAATGSATWATKLQQAMAFEYFALGERADLYRNIGWPHSRPSKCVLTPTDTVTKITTIEGYYAGDCEDVQKSKKMVSIIQ